MENPKNEGIKKPELKKTPEVLEETLGDVKEELVEKAEGDMGQVNSNTENIDYNLRDVKSPEAEEIIDTNEKIARGASEEFDKFKNTVKNTDNKEKREAREKLLEEVFENSVGGIHTAFHDKGFTDKSYGKRKDISKDSLNYFGANVNGSFPIKDKSFEEEGVNEAIAISPMSTEVYGEEEYTEGTIFKKKKKRRVETGRRDVNFDEIKEGGKKEKAYKFVYKTIDDDEKKAYQAPDGRYGQVMLVELSLPESIARKIFEEVKSEPKFAREIVEKLVKEKMKQDKWDGGEDEIPLRPPYEKWLENKGKSKMYIQEPNITEEGLNPDWIVDVEKDKPQEEVKPKPAEQKTEAKEKQRSEKVDKEKIASQVKYWLEEAVKVIERGDFPVISMEDHLEMLKDEISKAKENGVDLSFIPDLDERIEGFRKKILEKRESVIPNPEANPENLNTKQEENENSKENKNNSEKTKERFESMIEKYKDKDGDENKVAYKELLNIKKTVNPEIWQQTEKMEKAYKETEEFLSEVIVVISSEELKKQLLEIQETFLSQKHNVYFLQQFIRKIDNIVSGGGRSESIPERYRIQFVTRSNSLSRNINEITSIQNSFVKSIGIRLMTNIRNSNFCNELIEITKDLTGADVYNPSVGENIDEEKMECTRTVQGNEMENGKISEVLNPGFIIKMPNGKIKVLEVARVVIYKAEEIKPEPEEPKQEQKMETSETEKTAEDIENEKLTDKIEKEVNEEKFEDETKERLNKWNNKSEDEKKEGIKKEKGEIEGRLGDRIMAENSNLIEQKNVKEILKNRDELVELQNKFKKEIEENMESRKAVSEGIQDQLNQNVDLSKLNIGEKVMAKEAVDGFLKTTKNVLSVKEIDYLLEAGMDNFGNLPQTHEKRKIEMEELQEIIKAIEEYKEFMDKFEKMTEEQQEEAREELGRFVRWLNWVKENKKDLFLALVAIGVIAGVAVLVSSIGLPGMSVPAYLTAENAIKAAVGLAALGTAGYIVKKKKVQAVLKTAGMAVGLPILGAAFAVDLIFNSKKMDEFMEWATGTRMMFGSGSKKEK